MAHHLNASSQEDRSEFKVSRCYIVSSCTKKEKRTEKDKVKEEEEKTEVDPFQWGWRNSCVGVRAQGLGRFGLLQFGSVCFIPYHSIYISILAF